jgi:hypothetical protein
LLMWASLTPGAFSLTAETVNSSVSTESMNVVISAFLEPRPPSVPVRLSRIPIGGDQGLPGSSRSRRRIVFSAANRRWTGAAPHVSLPAAVDQSARADMAPHRARRCRTAQGVIRPDIRPLPSRNGWITVKSRT